MKELSKSKLTDFLQNERDNCYWFWFKGKINRKNLSGTLEWNGQRLKNGFYNCFDIMSGKWNGQSKAEFEKNYKRVKDIVDKSNGDCDKMVSLSRTQAGRIHDEWKALNRAMVAKEKGHVGGKYFEDFDGPVMAYEMTSDEVKEVCVEIKNFLTRERYFRFFEKHKHLFSKDATIYTFVSFVENLVNDLRDSEGYDCI